jgi:hypothetical protein
METEEKRTNQNVMNAMCYVPFVAFFLFFAEKQKTEEYKKHMIY